MEILEDDEKSPAAKASENEINQLENTLTEFKKQRARDKATILYGKFGRKPKEPKE